MRTLIHDWTEQAACLEVDPELFFPVSTHGPGEEQVMAAKAVCARCPVREQCLAYALDTRQAEGVWGGTDPAQRGVRIRR
ncbi:WhiB family transcriptional regulator [Nonomuraea endophytica]|uniref:Transcriptional regulator WhiB n=1 Tax=Nonomuraea endophytica TaxID=714136 RepID=A0A7W8A1T8_9ACTN|nr:WhiB family transcriptional regulator [Nonomuraea endophytica]MBB5077226.1 WhiB family redox-sensing transcriptional regulator [Nonomuraea endophytica]